MRKITLWLTATVAVLVLIFSYRTSTSGPRLGTVAVAPGAPAGVVAGGGATTTSGTMTVNGTSAQTAWGPVQVQVKIAAGRIADVIVLRHPTGSGMDQAINSFALPQLRAQVLAAQSANISGVSGATVTTGGYKQSLQAAINAAHFSGTPAGTVPPTSPVPPSLTGERDD
jgi:uncharacterized protein with FMN-binding domain